MSSFFGKDLGPEALPNFYGTFVERRNRGDKRNTGRPCDSEIELLSRAFVGKIFNAIGQTGRTFHQQSRFRPARAEERFGQGLNHKRPRSDPGAKVAFCMKLGEGKVDGESRNSQ